MTSRALRGIPLAPFLSSRSEEPMRSCMQSTARGHDWRADAFRRISRLLLIVAVPAGIIASPWRG